MTTETNVIGGLGDTIHPIGCGCEKCAIKFSCGACGAVIEGTHDAHRCDWRPQIKAMVERLDKLEASAPIVMKARRYTHPDPPQVCPGSQRAAPAYQGQTASSSTGWEPSECGICGQTVRVDGYKNTVVHPYLPVRR